MVYTVSTGRWITAVAVVFAMFSTLRTERGAAPARHTPPDAVDYDCSFVRSSA
jgi:hypothetical protein